jgi:hypothetical protein
VLIDPGGYWGPRAGLRAPGPLQAVRLVLAGRTIAPGGSLTRGGRRGGSG